MFSLEKMFFELISLLTMLKYVCSAPGVILCNSATFFEGTLKLRIMVFIRLSLYARKTVAL
jgi:hypothetical protein